VDIPFDGEAAGVPFTALPPAVPTPDPAPLLITWHMMGPPSTHAAFAAALPLAGVPAWRVHLGLPWAGSRPPLGTREDVLGNPVLNYIHPVVSQAAAEFPAALQSLRATLPVDGSPITVLGASLGGAVALKVLTDQDVPVAAAVLVNAAIRPYAVVDVLTAGAGQPWTPESRAVAETYDFVTRAPTLAARRPHLSLLILNGTEDYPQLLADADALAAAHHTRTTRIPGLAHLLADEPGTHPAPQLPLAKEVDTTITTWLTTLPAA
jgi:pimeloyl-ACP methyl ester carboxylesterase